MYCTYAVIVLAEDVIVSLEEWFVSPAAGFVFCCDVRCIVMSGVCIGLRMDCRLPNVNCSLVRGVCIGVRDDNLL